jgi:succinate dehydrogenase / fumarate reductase flavoprotein subunit
MGNIRRTSLLAKCCTDQDNQTLLSRPDGWAEAGCASVHGANRQVRFLIDLVVFGRAAAIRCRHDSSDTAKASRNAQTVCDKAFDRSTGCAMRTVARAPLRLRWKCKKRSEDAAVFRTDKTLKEGVGNDRYRRKMGDLRADDR